MLTIDHSEDDIEHVVMTADTRDRPSPAVARVTALAASASVSANREVPHRPAAHRDALVLNPIRNKPPLAAKTVPCKQSSSGNASNALPATAGQPQMSRIRRQLLQSGVGVASLAPSKPLLKR